MNKVGRSVAVIRLILDASMNSVTKRIQRGGKEEKKIIIRTAC